MKFKRDNVHIDFRTIPGTIISAQLKLKGQFLKKKKEAAVRSHNLPPSPFSAIQFPLSYLSRRLKIYFLEWAKKGSLD